MDKEKTVKTVTVVSIYKVVQSFCYSPHNGILDEQEYTGFLLFMLT